jgi:hypothetical protein
MVRIAHLKSVLLQLIQLILVPPSIIEVSRRPCPVGTGWVDPIPLRSIAVCSEHFEGCDVGYGVASGVNRIGVGAFVYRPGSLEKVEEPTDTIFHWATPSLVFIVGRSPLTEGPSPADLCTLRRSGTDEAD